FSGSATRKPVGQAAVELLFDNQDGRVGGPYANYAEIAIRRVVTRDGLSQYFLNGTHCRRRDITDIFLGTGMGPRSYAIIEQGMISRVIDAKPEDLRVYVEETAGISKYKERRRETENRIRHTRENLDRLNDLREELEKQLQNLARQSESAEKYKLFKAEESTFSEQLAALKWREYDADLQNKEAVIRSELNRLEAKQADVSALTKALEVERLQQADCHEQFNTIQKQFYMVAGQISRLEQTLQHHKDRENQLNQDKIEAQTALDRAQEHLQQDNVEIQAIQDRLVALEPEHQTAMVEYDAQQEVVLTGEQNLEAWRDQAEQIRQNTQVPVKKAEVEKTNIAHLEEQLRKAHEKKEKLVTELENLNRSEGADIQTLEARINDFSQNLEKLANNISQLRTQKQSYLETLRQLKQDIDADQSLLQKLEGRKASLEALQQAALGKQQGSVNVWLSEHHLGQNKRLAESIRVTPKWTKAVETVLSDTLEAVILSSADNIGQVLSAISDLPDGNLSIIYPSDNLKCSPKAAPTLLEKIENQPALLEQGLWSALVDFMHPIYIAETFSEAQALLSTLPEFSSVITMDGIWLSQGWVRFSKSTDPHSGILAREEALTELSSSICSLEEKLNKNNNDLQVLEKNLENCEDLFDNLLNEQRQTERNYNASQSDLKVHVNRLEQQKIRLTQIESEIREIGENGAHWQAQINEKRRVLQAALEEMADLEAQRFAHEAKKQDHELLLRHARQILKEQKEKEHQLAIQCQTSMTQLKALSTNIERSKMEIESILERRVNIEKNLDENRTPVKAIHDELEKHLSEHATLEQALTLARENVHASDEKLQQYEKAKQVLGQDIESLRADLEAMRLDSQTLKVHRQNALDALKDVQKAPEEILVTVPPEANSALWQEALERVGRRIQRLGPINLVAIEEFTAAKERKTYLDKQNEDLQEALTTLDQAISKIDKETRARFKETFNNINENFKVLFPKLFGGGQAYLSLTGEDLLDTGIAVVARPPGKRNSLIQQLSGGEKALTAVALVFAFFQLNPAPFCMLDEVDAPLDDSNVGRFCNLVKNLSETVQFIYITHNKLAMEMAEQLQGVTMREPGVSRIVTVDVSEAEALAQKEGIPNAN
ncbi:MAG TPA: chromosome segregation protein SMC, partial [Gammaproteobacteria bacterium]|nr:chromosome segregation protein SMC [Gammaproteobacteria bacterium]